MQKPIMYLIHRFDVMAGNEIIEVQDEEGKTLLEITEDDLLPMETAGLDPYDHEDVFAYANHLERDAFGTYEVVWESVECKKEFSN